MLIVIRWIYLLYPLSFTATEVNWNGLCGGAILCLENWVCDIWKLTGACNEEVEQSFRLKKCFSRMCLISHALEMAWLSDILSKFDNVTKLLKSCLKWSIHVTQMWAWYIFQHWNIYIVILIKFQSFATQEVVNFSALLKVSSNW